MKIMQTLTSPKSIFPFLTPFVVYMICTSLEPSPATYILEPQIINFAPFPWFYAGKLFLTLLAIAFCFPAWGKWLRRPSFYGILAGIIGAVIWIGLCQMEKRSIPDFLPGMGLEQIFPTTRDGYNWLPGQAPTTLDRHWILYYSGYLIRLSGLVLVVPLIEELFLRGFVLRYFWKAPEKTEKNGLELESVNKEDCSCDSQLSTGNSKKDELQTTPSDNSDTPTEWYDVPFGSVCPMVWAISAIYPVLTHPEALAGIVWFCGMTFLAWKTKSLSDCICAHMITNLALGLWVAYSGQWYLM